MGDSSRITGNLAIALVKVNFGLDVAATYQSPVIVQSILQSIDRLWPFHALGTRPGLDTTYHS